MGTLGSGRPTGFSESSARAGRNAGRRDIGCRKGALVWRSLASSDIRANDKPESRDRKIAKAMEKMLKNYPPRR